jgi:hypothetical protein
MNSTSPGSRLVIRAAISPAFSSTGPEVVFRDTSISLAMMLARVVLPSPGGPKIRVWSRGSPRPRAADKYLHLLAHRGWPMYSARAWAARRDPGVLVAARGSGVDKTVGLDHRRMLSCAGWISGRGGSVPRCCQWHPSRRRRSAARPPPACNRATRGPPRPPRARSIGRRRHRPWCRAELLQPAGQAVAHLHQQPLGGLLADTGQGHQGRDRSPACTARAKLSASMPERIVSARRGPIPVTRMRCRNSSRSRSAAKP